MLVLIIIIAGILPTRRTEAQMTPPLNTPGNILVVDQGNDRVLEMYAIDQDWEKGLEFDGEIEDFVSWPVPFCNNEIQLGIPFAVGGCDYSRNDNMFGPVFAQRLPCGNTLVVSAGRPDCPDNRVMIFDTYGRNDFWQYGSYLPGDGSGQLNHPTHAAFTVIDLDTDKRKETDNECVFWPNMERDYWLGDVMITDSGNNRILLVDACTQEIEWMFGPTSGHLKLNNPTMTQVLANGHILITDNGNGRILEINIKKQLIAEYNISTPSPVSVGRSDWTWINNVNHDSDMIGTELILDSVRNQFFLLDADGRQKFVFPTEYWFSTVEDINYWILESVVRVRDKNSYLFAFSYPECSNCSYVYGYNKFKNNFTLILGINGFWDGQVFDRIPSISMIGDYTGLTVPVTYSPPYPHKQCPWQEECGVCGMQCDPDQTTCCAGRCNPPSWTCDPTYQCCSLGGVCGPPRGFPPPCDPRIYCCPDGTCGDVQSCDWHVTDPLDRCFCPTTQSSSPQPTPLT